jgi:hypothetical protein
MCSIETEEGGQVFLSEGLMLITTKWMGHKKHGLCWNVGRLHQTAKRNYLKPPQQEIIFKLNNRFDHAPHRGAAHINAQIVSGAN